ncbi:MAG TPA: hypothetical protein PLO78_06515 [Candidatus Omnitrophota bacterium]|nr:hypothetical protein [Candidatus Omnitrophota bacterium]
MRFKKSLRFGICVFLLAMGMVNGVKAAEALSKEKIIEIAKAKAVERGYDIDSMKIIYDDSNEMFKKHLKRKGVSKYNKETNEWKPVRGTTPEEDRPKLKGKDYQTLYFGPKQMMKGGDLWVFVDRKTGEVLDTVGGK